MNGSEWLSIVAIVAALALLAEGAQWLRRRWMLVKVEGDSMEPTLHSGDEVVARRTRRIEVGHIVVAAAPDPMLGWAEAARSAGRFGRRRGKGPWWVKRVAAGPGDPMPGLNAPVPPGHYFLLSDNPAGEDSRRHGPCPAGAIAGVMTRKF